MRRRTGNVLKCESCGKRSIHYPLRLMRYRPGLGSYQTVAIWCYFCGFRKLAVLRREDTAHVD